MINMYPENRPSITMNRHILDLVKAFTSYNFIKTLLKESHRSSDESYRQSSFLA